MSMLLPVHDVPTRPQEKHNGLLRKSGLFISTLLVSVLPRTSRLSSTRSFSRSVNVGSRPLSIFPVGGNLLGH